MRRDEIVKNALSFLKEQNVINDFRYDHFRESEAVDTPFAVWRRVAVPYMNADDKAYCKNESEVDIELYADDDDEMAVIMAALEEALDAYEITYEKTADTVYIESEDFYESLYEIGG